MFSVKLWSPSDGPFKAVAVLAVGLGSVQGRWKASGLGAPALRSDVTGQECGPGTRILGREALRVSFPHGPPDVPRGHWVRKGQRLGCGETQGKRNQGWEGEDAVSALEK